MATTLVVLGLVLTMTAPAEAATNRQVAMRIANQLNCQSSEYFAGRNLTPKSRGQLDCTARRQDYIVYVFRSNKARAAGVRFWKRWSGPSDTYYFARATRAVVAPQGKNGSPAYTRRWARRAANRTGGSVFSG